MIQLSRNSGFFLIFVPNSRLSLSCKFQILDIVDIKTSKKLQLTDGKHTAEATIPIDIIPVDDETPRVTINHGLTLENEQPSGRIGSDVLKVSDIDSVDEELMLVITYPPRMGDLKLDDGTPEGKFLSVGDVFTMEDLSFNKIIYTRKPGEISKEK